MSFYDVDPPDETGVECMDCGAEGCDPTDPYCDRCVARLEAEQHEDEDFYEDEAAE